ncbi:MAG: hypothetical protein ACREL3_11295, partial [Gemmatimonadales bacterium]
MDLIRRGRRLAPLLLVAACSRAQPAMTVPAGGGPAANSAALPAVPERHGPLHIQVVYPPSDAVVQVRDSNFIFGSVGSGDAKLTINGQPVRVWPNGAWLAYLPFPPDSVARFQLEARNATDSTSLTYMVRRTVDELTPPPGTPVWVDSLSLAPRGRVWLGQDEYLPLSVRASEGAEVRLRLPDGTIVPLVAQPRPPDVPDGVRVFGGGRSDVASRRDRYAGLLRGRTFGPDPGPVLPPSGYASPTGILTDTSWATVEAIIGSDTARARWPLQVAVLDSMPVVAEFNDDTAHSGATDSSTSGRALPEGTYVWFFPTGTHAEISGRRNGDLRVRLSTSAEAWIPVTDAQPLPRGTPARRGIVGSVTLTPSPGYATLRVPVSQRLPFRVIEGDRTLALRFYGAGGDVNWMRYGAADSLVRKMGWEQSASDEVTLTLELSRPVWGYRTRWEGNDLLLDLRRPPPVDRGNPLSGRLIAVD